MILSGGITESCLPSLRERFKVGEEGPKGGRLSLIWLLEISRRIGTTRNNVLEALVCIMKNLMQEPNWLTELQEVTRKADAASGRWLYGLCPGNRETLVLGNYMTKSQLKFRVDQITRRKKTYAQAIIEWWKYIVIYLVFYFVLWGFFILYKNQFCFLNDWTKENDGWGLQGKWRVEFI